MPIYAYRCDSCGVEKDVLQKLSDAPLSTCPDCGAATFRKRLSAPAFQLKGSGWYVTDFRDGGKKSKADGTPDSAAGEAKPVGSPEGKARADGSSEAKADGKDRGAAGDGKRGDAAQPGPAPAAAPAASAATGATAAERKQA